MSLDDASSGPPYQRIASTLRREIDSGRHPVGAQLPTQQSLVRRFEVSRATVQRALDELRKERYIDSHQGRGSYVLPRGRDRSAPSPAGVGLAQHIDTAFQARRVTIDVLSLTSETLYAAIQAPLQRIREGVLQPESVAVRLLLPESDKPLAIPRLIADPADPRPMERFRRLANSQAIALQSALEALSDLDLVQEVAVELKSVPFAPLHKLYLLNGTEALFAYDEVIARTVPYGGADLEIYDVLGLGATLFHRSAATDTAAPEDREFVAVSQRWFDGLWSTIAAPLEV